MPKIDLKNKFAAVRVKIFLVTRISEDKSQEKFFLFVCLFLFGLLVRPTPKYLWFQVGMSHTS